MQGGEGSAKVCNDNNRTSKLLLKASGQSCKQPRSGHGSATLQNEWAAAADSFLLIAAEFCSRQTHAQTSSRLGLRAFSAHNGRWLADRARRWRPFGARRMNASGSGSTPACAEHRQRAHEQERVVEHTLQAWGQHVGTQAHAGAGSLHQRGQPLQWGSRLVEQGRSGLSCPPSFCRDACCAPEAEGPASGFTRQHPSAGQPGQGSRPFLPGTALQRHSPGQSTGLAGSAGRQAAQPAPAAWPPSPGAPLRPAGGQRGVTGSPAAVLQSNEWAPMSNGRLASSLPVARTRRQVAALLHMKTGRDPAATLNTAAQILFKRAARWAEGGGEASAAVSSVGSAVPHPQALHAEKQRLHLWLALIRRHSFPCAAQPLQSDLQGVAPPGLSMERMHA